MVGNFVTFLYTKCLHNRPDGYILNDRHYRHYVITHALKSPVNQTGKMVIKHVKSWDAFTLENLSFNYSFQNDDTQGLQNIFFISGKELCERALFMVP